MPKYIVEETSDAFEEPFILRNTQVNDDSADRYYDIGGIYQTFLTEQEAQNCADQLNQEENS